ncbi:uncharacterized protein LOC127252769 [Andrographis paniculata]|uniref:uncharacterized protein LOC127252769 n=1 Tax=Andrographis paniculata TaxID=175694 RepID=UPI0021E92634|nr:uncharacterized protein LOC127252769 [Andrographis paniculata]
MGNCQAVDNATLVIQHPTGRAEKLYSPVTASHIMKANPGHYVALLLTTTVYSNKTATAPENKNAPLRVTRIKLLRPTDTLILGHVYRLVTSQEVMKGLLAKKQAKMQQLQKNGTMDEKQSSELASAVRKPAVKNNNQAKPERHRSRNSTPSKSRTWQPALKSISESAS